jgi:hypothetical protein
MEKRRISALCLILLFGQTISLLPASAQGGIPLPGAGTNDTRVLSAPVPGANPQIPLPGTNRNARPGASAYQELPLSPADAEARLEELRSLLPASRPQDLQEPILHLCDWLADMADAHWKLHLSFTKNDSTKLQAEAEKQSAHKFSTLKNQALLLKAELLIKQQRYPEALGPLVDIVSQEPRSTTGQTAYKHLKEIGFAQEPEPKQEAKPEAKAEQVGPQGSAPSPQPGPTATDTTSAPAKPALATRPQPTQATHSKPPATQSSQAAPSTHAGRPAAAKSAKSAQAASQSTKWISGTPFGAGRSKRHN